MIVKPRYARILGWLFRALPFLVGGWLLFWLNFFWWGLLLEKIENPELKNADWGIFFLLALLLFPVTIVYLRKASRWIRQAVHK